MKSIEIKLGTSGTIDLQQITGDEERERRQLAEWIERAHRNELRREESQVMRAWWRADETARRTIEVKNKDVFARIRANRRKAAAILKAERDFQDARMQTLGYEIDASGQLPRYRIPRGRRSVGRC